jgi:DNA (cytosine-5)-methyltransferase 1
MGQRVLDDPRNALVLQFVRVAKELEPNYFVFENVKGLTQGKHRAFLDELIAAFAQIGYSVTLPWRVLNAMDYGVPQDRERLILLGHRKGKPAPVYPSSGPLVPTCRDAIADLPDAETFEELWETDEVRTDEWGTPSAYARTLRCLDLKSWAFGYRRKWDPSLLTGSLRTEHTTISRRRFAETRPGETEPISRFFKLPADGVCNTLRAGTDSARGAFTSPRPIHYGLPRCITVREMARLHGFPDWFRFHETKWHGARQIGNAVPPPMARAIASSIVGALGATPQRPTRVLGLGDPKLLRMDVSAASRFWGVPVPLRRRDRKSGAIKRRQSDIEALA